MVRLGIHKVTHLTAKAHRQLRRVRALDDLLMGVLTKEPCGEQVAGKLGLGMPGRHVDNKALALAPSHALERVCHLGVVPPSNKGRPHFPHEGKEVVLAQLAALQLGQLFQLSQQPLLLVQRQARQNLRQVS